MDKIRIVQTGDAQDLLNIYAPFILNSGITQEAEVPSLQDFQNRIKSTVTNFPWLVSAEGNVVTGYAYAARHRERSGYRWCVETSVYIHSGFYGKKTATRLYKALLAILRCQNYVNAYAVITLPNEPSVRFHEKFGFRHFATYEKIGYKLGKWHDVGWWRLVINEHFENPAEPLPFSSLNPAEVKRILESADILFS